MRAADVERWADAGLVRVWEGLAPDPALPFTVDEVMAGVRAAYVAGYMDALKAPEPAVVSDAVKRATILGLRLPV